MEFELLTLAGTKYKGEARSVHVRTATGEMGILPHHENLTTIVLPGAITITTPSGVEHLASFGGLLQVTDNHVRLLADEAEHADELIHHEIEAALEYAKSLQASAKTKHELHHAQTLIDRHAVRLHVAGLRRRHHKKR
jgi:F-type H+-transporting ATPase subunit epsilon